MNLVTGGTGLLGSHIVEQRRKRYLPVRVLVRPGSDRTWLESQDVEFVEGDITDPSSLAGACQGVDAGQTDPGGGIILVQLHRSAVRLVRLLHASGIERPQPAVQQRGQVDVVRVEDARPQHTRHSA